MPWRKDSRGVGTPAIAFSGWGEFFSELGEATDGAKGDADESIKPAARRRSHFDLETNGGDDGSAITEVSGQPVDFEVFFDLMGEGVILFLS